MSGVEILPYIHSGGNPFLWRYPEPKALLGIAWNGSVELKYLNTAVVPGQRLES